MRFNDWTCLVASFQQLAERAERRDSVLHAFAAANARGSRRATDDEERLTGRDLELRAS